MLEGTYAMAPKGMDATTTFAIVYTSTKTNPDLQPKDFVYGVPPGTELTDFPFAATLKAAIQEADKKRATAPPAG